MGQEEEGCSCWTVGCAYSLAAVQAEVQLDHSGFCSRYPVIFCWEEVLQGAAPLFAAAAVAAVLVSVELAVFVIGLAVGPVGQSLPGPGRS